MRRSTKKGISTAFDWTLRIVGLSIAVFSLGPNFQIALQWWKQLIGGVPNLGQRQITLLQLTLLIFAALLIVLGNFPLTLLRHISRAFQSTSDLQALHKYEIAVAALEKQMEQAKSLSRPSNFLVEWEFNDWKDRTLAVLKDNLGENGVETFNNTMRGANSLGFKKYVELAANYLDDLAGKLSVDEFKPAKPAGTNGPAA